MLALVITLLMATNNYGDFLNQFHSLQVEHQSSSAIQRVKCPFLIGTMYVTRLISEKLRNDLRDEFWVKVKRNFLRMKYGVWGLGGSQP